MYLTNHYIFFFYTLNSGLCGDFNDVESDDFKIINGMIEGTAVTFANTWKTETSCPDVNNMFQNPCNMSSEKGSLSLCRTKNLILGPLSANTLNN